MMSTMLAFSESAEETRTYRALLRSELTEFRKDYKILLYGGRMNLEVGCISVIKKKLGSVI